MLPCLPTSDSPDRNSIYAKHLSDFTISNSFWKPPDFSNVFLFKFCASTLLSLCLTIFENHVRRVVSMCAYEVMIWINTRWIVSAWAIVTKLHTFRDWASKKFPNDSMRRCSSIWAVVNSVISAFTFSAVATSPQPAGFGFVNQFPDSVWSASPLFITGARAKAWSQTWPMFKWIITLLAKSREFGRGCVRHNESLSFCLGGTGRLEPLCTAANLTI